MQYGFVRYVVFAGLVALCTGNAHCAEPVLNSIVTVYYETAVNGRLFDDAIIVQQPTPADLVSIYHQDLGGGIGADVNCKINRSGSLKKCQFAELKPATPAARSALKKVMKHYMVKAPQPQGRIKYVNITMILVRDARFPGAGVPCIAPFCVTDIR